MGCGLLASASYQVFTSKSSAQTPETLFGNVALRLGR